MGLVELGSSRWVEDTANKPLGILRALVGTGREGVRISRPSDNLTDQRDVFSYLKIK